MAYEWSVKAWLMAERAAVHGEIALKIAGRDHKDSLALEQAKQMSRALRDQADSQLRAILWMIAHGPRSP